MSGIIYIVHGDILVIKATAIKNNIAIPAAAQTDQPDDWLIELEPAEANKLAESGFTATPYQK